MATTAPHAACPGCGKPLDPLRAGHVAVLGDRMLYFCDVDCKRAYLGRSELAARDDMPTVAPPDVAPSVESPSPAVVRSPAVRAAPRASKVPRRARPGRRGNAKPKHVEAGRLGPVRGGAAALDALAIGLGLLAIGSGLLGSRVAGARLALLLTASALLVARSLRRRDEAASIDGVSAWVPCVVATFAACWARLTGDPHAFAIETLAGVGVAAAIVTARAIERARAPVEAARAQIEAALRAPVRVVHDGRVAAREDEDVRAGEQILVEEGETVGVDGIVAAGEARVIPWLEATVEATRHEGQAVVAGARVVSSRLRITTTWAGRDRAWVKLFPAAGSPARAIDVAAPVSKLACRTVERGAVVAAVLTGFASAAESALGPQIVGAACAGAMALGIVRPAAFTAFQLARAHLRALSSGIAYKDAAAFERAGRVDVAVLGARGTVLVGEPELVAVEAVETARASKRPPASAPVDPTTRILALAAGAQTASSQPYAAAVVRAALARGTRPDPIRNATVRSGLGVTALASTGERLVVGSRTLMLEEKIGVAVADARISALEADGLSVLVVALAERVIGLIALRDGVRVGARAAVQRLLDAGIEPVLLSGEARETCETIGRALDIEHVRPEVLPADRAAEIAALAEGGATVAFIGHPAVDDPALGASHVAVAMASAGATPGEWAVALAGDDVRDGARALALPRQVLSQIRLAVSLGVAPGLLALVAVGLGIAPLSTAPLAAAVGSLAMGIYARESAGRSVGS